MASAAQVTKAILQQILVQDSEAPLIASEFQDTIFAMNNYMLALDASGVKLGYTEVTNLGDPVTIPLGALRGVIANVALDVAGQFDVQPTQTLILAARQGMDAMRKLGQSMGPTQYPSTLPIGSGSEGDSSFETAHFYPDLEHQILTEASGPIGLESDTVEET